MVHLRLVVHHKRIKNCWISLSPSHSFSLQCHCLLLPPPRGSWEDAGGSSQGSAGSATTVPYPIIVRFASGKPEKAPLKEEMDGGRTHVMHESRWRPHLEIHRLEVQSWESHKFASTCPIGGWPRGQIQGCSSVMKKITPSLPSIVKSRHFLEPSMIRGTFNFARSGRFTIGSREGESS